MAHYIAGGLMLVLLLGAAAVGLEAYGIYDAVRMVDAALLDGQLALATEGGVTARVEELIQQHIASEGGASARIQIAGSSPKTPFGQMVTLRLTYDAPYALTVLTPERFASRRGTFRIERSVATLSAYQP